MKAKPTIDARQSVLTNANKTFYKKKRTMGLHKASSCLTLFLARLRGKFIKVPFLGKGVVPSMTSNGPVGCLSSTLLLQC